MCRATSVSKIVTYLNLQPHLHLHLHQCFLKRPSTHQRSSKDANLIEYDGLSPQAALRGRGHHRQRATENLCDTKRLPQLPDASNTTAIRLQASDATPKHLCIAAAECLPTSIPSIQQEGIPDFGATEPTRARQYHPAPAVRRRNLWRNAACHQPGLQPRNKRRWRNATI